MEHFMPQHPSWTQCWRDQQDQDILDAAGQRDGGAEWKLHLPSQEPVRGEWIQDDWARDEGWDIHFSLYMRQ